MFTDFRFKLVLLGTLLVIPLVFGVPSTGYSGGFEEPPDEAGGDIVIKTKVKGWIEIVQGDPVGPFPAVNATFYSGTCKANSGDDDDGKTRRIVQANLGQIFPATVGTLTADDLLDISFEAPFGPSDLPQCFGNNLADATGDLVVVKVKEFFNNGSTVVARIVAKRVIRAP